MANERDQEQFGQPDRQSEFSQDKQQPPIGQQGQQNQAGEPGSQSTMSGQQGNEGGLGGQSSSGQASYGSSSQSDTSLADRDPNLSQDSEASGSSDQSGGFVGSQGTNSDEYLQEGSTGGSDFASEGQGALDDQDEDTETGQPSNRDSDIEGSSGSTGGSF